MPGKKSGSMPRRDIVLLGGSAGALEGLKQIAGRLPPDLPAALFVAVHVSQSSPSRLPQLLERAGRLPARHAVDGDPIEPGRILVAPPDHHLILHEDRCELSHGPRENSTRPAIDPLFRSAARAFGERVCAVVLSGYLDDGSAGMQAVADAGGAVIVQDPDEAAFPDMPRNALLAVGSAEVLVCARIARRLIELACGEAVPNPEPSGLDEPATPGLTGNEAPGDDQPGEPSGLTCPDCHGVLWVGAEPGRRELRCRTGHRFNLDTLASRQREAVEEAMWSAVRALQEAASLARRIAAQARSNGNARTAERYALRERTAERQARVLEDLLLDGHPR